MAGEFHHATCLRLGAHGVLLRGPSGSGKSDLALRLIRSTWAGELVADDQVLIEAEDGQLFASAPVVLAGLIELRGLGMLQMPYLARTLLHLAVDLVPRDDVPRMPDPAALRLCGLELPRIVLHAFDASAPDKLGLAAKLIPARGFAGEDGIIGCCD
ncbi:MAG: HPr kinase/phosphatase C-terminal domain-containing protein [Parvibaculum sp.]|nr:HPr kinase/phosphatase C-terminal domain-containing protein [Parvibaculum sp.]|tara:strand:- start:1026 stop:1496 length:471 start_codon:yes stop_codon:yes gene_type:complete